MRRFWNNAISAIIVTASATLLALVTGCATRSEAGSATEASNQEVAVGEADGPSTTPTAVSSELSSSATVAEQPSSPTAAAPAAPQPPKGKPPPADRGPRKPGEAEKITFDDLNIGMQMD